MLLGYLSRNKTRVFWPPLEVTVGNSTHYLLMYRTMGNECCASTVCGEGGQRQIMSRYVHAEGDIMVSTRNAIYLPRLELDLEHTAWPTHFPTQTND